MTGNSDVESFKNVLCKNMVRTKGSAGKPQGIRPLDNQIQLFFIEDMNMCHSDEWDVKIPHELLRTYFDYSGWYEMKERQF
jgi:hypothetical protein